MCFFILFFSLLLCLSCFFSHTLTHFVSLFISVLLCNLTEHGCQYCKRTFAFYFQFYSMPSIGEHYEWKHFVYSFRIHIKWCYAINGRHQTHKTNSITVWFGSSTKMYLTAPHAQNANSFISIWPLYVIFLNILFDIL